MEAIRESVTSTIIAFVMLASLVLLIIGYIWGTGRATYITRTAIKKIFHPTVSQEETIGCVFFIMFLATFAICFISVAYILLSSVIPFLDGLGLLNPSRHPRCVVVLAVSALTMPTFYCLSNFFMNGPDPKGLTESFKKDYPDTYEEFKTEIEARGSARGMTFPLPDNENK